VENLLLTPKISQRSLELNPAVSFLSVLAFGAVFGALGAFLSLPVVATIQAVSSTYLRRHELVDPTLLDEETPRRKPSDKDAKDPKDPKDAEDAAAQA
jgi:predicted PurR-regulated permease PerM